MIRLNPSLISQTNDHSSLNQPPSVTLLLADSSISKFFERFSAQYAQQISSKVQQIFEDQIRANGGDLIKITGDDILSYFLNVEEAVFTACEINKAIRDDLSLIGLNIPIRAGLHHGQVLLKGDKISGDAIAIVDRVLKLAKEGQILTTQETANLLPERIKELMRSVGKFWIPNRQDDVEITEILWYESSDSQTQVISYQAAALRNLLFARLFLEYRGKIIELIPGHRIFKIGRNKENDLVVSGEQVSRSHAIIEFRQGKFVLVDQSANGTHVLMENAACIFLRREAFTLHDQGKIFLGHTASKEDSDMIHYSVIQNAEEVYTRESQIKNHVQNMHIEIDKKEVSDQVRGIIESDYFKRLNAIAGQLRTKRTR
jgi:class 3 adenylate cyclase